MRDFIKSTLPRNILRWYRYLTQNNQVSAQRSQRPHATAIVRLLAYTAQPLVRVFELDYISWL